MKLKRFVPPVALLCVLVLVTAIGAAPAPDAVTISITSEPVSLDNGMHTDLMSAIVGAGISDALIWIGPGGTYRPAMATSWENVDETTWRFRLRRGVRFANGESFTAQAVKYSAERIMNPANNSPASRTVTAQVKEVRIIDDYTVDIVTKDPYPALLSDLIWMLMVPPRLAEQIGVQGFGRAPVGLGAMMFVEWLAGSRIVLKANPNYWGGTPQVQRLIYRPIKEESTALAALLAGETDIMLGLSPENAQRVERHPSTTVQGLPGVRQVYLAMDVLNPPFTDKRVRQAMNYAINVDTLNKNILEGRGVRIAGAFWPQTIGFNAAVKPYPFDPNRAKRLLAEAGYPNGFSVRLNVTLAGEGIIKTQELAESIQGYLRDVGVNVEIVIHENAVFWQKYNARDYKGAMYIASWGTGQVEGRHLRPLFHSTTRGYYYRSPQADAFIDGCTTTVRLEPRKQACAQLQAFLQDEAPWVFLYAQPALYGLSKRIKWGGTREDFMIHPSEIGVSQ